jgi:hypothetical protein
MTMTAAHFPLPALRSAFCLGLAIAIAGCAAAPRIGGGTKTGSLGHPERGSLSDGKQLKSFSGAIVLDPDRCWGAPESVDLLVYAILETQKAFPDSSDLVIGDFSREHGGPLSPHISHQSGLDVDVGFFLKKDMPRRGFVYVRPEEIDLDRTWYFLETLLLTDRVQYVLMDYELQAGFFGYLQYGYSGKRLAYWLQYPQGIACRCGVIRHAHGHHDHMHIRFKCPETDIGCGR